MKSELWAELDLLNRNVDELIRLARYATDAGIWTRQQAERHITRLGSLRAKLNADFSELLASHERANRLQLSTQDTPPLTKR